MIALKRVSLKKKGLGVNLAASRRNGGIMSGLLYKMLRRQEGIYWQPAKPLLIQRGVLYDCTSLKGADAGMR